MAPAATATQGPTPSGGNTLPWTPTGGASNPLANKSSKNTPCRNFFGSGVCKFGDTCNFSHTGGDADTTKMNNSGGNPKAFGGAHNNMHDLTPEMKQRLEKMINEYSTQKPCWYFQQGTCNKGAKCNFSHDNQSHPNKRQSK